MSEYITNYLAVVITSWLEAINRGMFIVELQNSIFSKEEINQKIEDNIGFIVKTVSNVTNTYVSLENDESFSIGLMAFAEALDKFDAEKGNFYPFAKLVIESRIINFLKRENKYQNASLDELMEKDFDIAEQEENQDTNEFLQQEIMEYKKELAQFGLTMDILAQSAPKHKDTRTGSVRLAKNISDDDLTVNKIYEKKRLPIKEVALRFIVTEKFVKRNKNFILGTSIVFIKKFRSIMLWIREAVKDDVL